MRELKILFLKVMFELCDDIENVWKRRNSWQIVVYVRAAFVKSSRIFMWKLLLEREREREF